MDRGSSKRIWYAIHEHADQARLSKELATLHDDVPLDGRPRRLALREPDRERAHTLFKALGFGSLTREFEPRRRRRGGDAGGEPRRQRPGRYETVLDRSSAGRVVAACREAGAFAVDTETDGLDPLRAAWSVSPWRGTKARRSTFRWVMTTRRAGATVARLGAPTTGPLLADPAVAQDRPEPDLRRAHLRRHGMPVEGWGLDTMVAAFLLNSGPRELLHGQPGRGVSRSRPRSSTKRSPARAPSRRPWTRSTWSGSPSTPPRTPR